MKSPYDIKTSSRFNLNIAEMFYEDFQRFKTYALTDVQRSHIYLICNPSYANYNYCHGYIQEVYQRTLGFRFACMSILSWEYGYNSEEYNTMDLEILKLQNELLLLMRSVTEIYCTK